MTTFGIELEVVPVAGREVGFKARVTRALQDLGLSAESTYYSGRAYSRWQVKDDVSVSIRRNGQNFTGCEVVSPVLEANEASWLRVESVCRAIEAAGGTANMSTGMHVHVGIAGRSVEEIKNVVRAYGTFAPQIDSVLPRSRRQDGRSSRWCQPLWTAGGSRDSFLSRLNDCENIRSIQCLIEARNSRYSALSLSAYPRIGTIEFRQHSGTADAVKASTWARWCVEFVENFARVDVTRTTTGNSQVMRRIAGTGAPRMPQKQCAAKLALSRMVLFGDALNAETMARWTDVQGSNPEKWVKLLAKRYGYNFAQQADGSWIIDTGLEQETTNVVAETAQTDPFSTCFGLFDGALAYFGRRRSALA